MEIRTHPVHQSFSADDLTTSTDIIPVINTTSNISESNGIFFYKDEQLTFLYILFILIVTGNALVIIAILSSRNRKSRMHIFILNLAFADLSAGLVNVLTDIVWKNTVEWQAGYAGCIVVRYGQSVVTYGATYALVALSIDRLNAIARPMSFTNNKFRTRLLIGLAWLLSLVFSVPMLIINEVQDHGEKVGLQCAIEFPHAWNWKLYITVIAFVVFFIPAIIIAVCYIIIVVIIWRKTSSGGVTSAAYANTATATTNKTSHFVKSGGQMYVAINNSHFREGSASSRGVIPRAKMKTIKMTLVIVLVFIICWSPYFMFDILAVYGVTTSDKDFVAISTFMQSLAPLNSAANPLIYAIFNYNTCFRLFRCRRARQHNSYSVNTQVSHGGGVRRGACD